MAVVRQTVALCRKTLLIAGVRHSPSTSFRAFALPIIFTAFLAYARYLFVPRAEHGIGTPAPVQRLADAIPNNRKLVFVHNGLGDEVDKLIEAVSRPVRDAGKTVVVVEDPVEVSTECQQALRGSSKCYCAVVFHNAPSSEDDNTGWNYTLRGDTAFGTNIYYDTHDNDVQKFLLPAQHAIDFYIANANESTPIPEEMLFTKTSEEERNNNIRHFFQEAIVNALGIAFYLGHVGIIYQMCGFIAMEREQGISILIEAMGGKKVSRLLSYHLSFNVLWAPGFIVMAAILQAGIMIETNMGIMIIYYLLVGLASASFALFGAAFFRKAQLSGITVTIVVLLLGIVSQITMKKSVGLIYFLSFISPSSAYVYFLAIVSRFEHAKLGTSLTASPPLLKDAGLDFKGIIIWIGLIFQIFFYFGLAMAVEHWRYGTSSKSRKIGTNNPENAVEIDHYTKEFRPGRFSKMEKVVAVNDLTLNVRKGTIFGLLGANGSGKTTTLESIAGTGRMGQFGEIRVGASDMGGIGICPQKNVLWDVLTVEEHVQIWNKIKCAGDSKESLKELIRECDLEIKSKSQSRTLSGGQKRKLQLAIMFTGGSSVCAIDEVSSGLDPLSRRKIWEIILGARGERTIMLTTHFLDEADLLSDYIAILSKGHLKAEGSSLNLKAEYGGGFRIYAPADSPNIVGTSIKRLADSTVYRTPDSAGAGRVIAELENNGITEYNVAGPTIEDAFLKLAEETAETVSKSTEHIVSEEGVQEAEATGSALKYVQSYTNRSVKDGVDLQSGSRVPILKQAWVFFKKRLTIAKRNYLPLIAAFALPIIAAGCTMLFVKDYQRPGCSPEALSDSFNLDDFEFDLKFQFLAGPSSRMMEFANLQQSMTQFIPGGVNAKIKFDENSIKIVDTLDEFYDFINSNYSTIYPGGIFLRDDDEPPIFAFRANFMTEGTSSAILLQNLLNRVAYGVNVTTTYQQLDRAFRPGQGDTLQFVTYFGLVMSAFPAFFALYPTIERIRNIRALHYSNGARSVPLWLAYAFFDFIITTVASAIIVIIMNAASDQWYEVGYVFVVLVFYCLSAILTAYVISLFAKTQLSAFAFTAGGNAVLFLIYFVAYMSVINGAPPGETDKILNIMHFIFALFAPIASLVRTLFIALNSFSILCRDKSVATDPHSFLLYGGPITYLIIQCIVLYGVLIWWESGRFRMQLRKDKHRTEDIEEKKTVEKEVMEELKRVETVDDKEGLRVQHVSKRFGKNQAVDDVSFGVSHSEVFALLGPNGAGKTTTINMIRGELYADSGDVLVEGIPVSRNRNEARTHLGVCPQFDAIDRMTVLEHLRFYARVRGVADPEYNVQQVIKAVGLEAYGNRLAESLSGGNKRKLSLGIALMGNPTVLLLDEPSSGMDAAAKRVMWRTLASVVPGRSLVLTTHSMEEADALATRAGIVAKRMLALGTTDYLRKKHGDRYFIQLLAKSAPNTSQEEMTRLKEWIASSFPGAELEDKSFNGQIRFSIPANSHLTTATSSSVSTTNDSDSEALDVSPVTKQKATKGGGGISRLFSVLEDGKEEMGLQNYSVQQTSLEDIFLEIVRAEGVREEGYKEEKKGWWGRVLGRK